MPKGQQRGNKEAKKPKKVQAPLPALAPIIAALDVRTVAASRLLELKEFGGRFDDILELSSQQISHCVR